MARAAQTNSLLVRILLGSAAIVVGLMLLLGLLAGPFGAIFMGIGAGLLVVPAAVIFVVVARPVGDRTQAKGSLVAVIILGWSLALVCGVLIGSIAAPGVAASMNLDVAPIVFWLALLAPFALTGAVIAATWTLVSSARAERRAALP